MKNIEKNLKLRSLQFFGKMQYDVSERKKRSMA